MNDFSHYETSFYNQLTLVTKRKQNRENTTYKFRILQKHPEIYNYNMLALLAKYEI